MNRTFERALTALIRLKEMRTTDAKNPFGKNAIVTTTEVNTAAPKRGDRADDEFLN